MNAEERENIKNVYKRFLNSEERGWDSLDDYLDLLDYLDDDQLSREAEVLFLKHKEKAVMCKIKHKKPSECFVPYILRAVETILNFYKKNGKLNDSHKYILQYYLALTQNKFIYTK